MLQGFYIFKFALHQIFFYTKIIKFYYRNINECSYNSFPFYAFIWNIPIYMKLLTATPATDIAALEQKLIHAISNGNFRTLDQLYHENLIVNNSIGQTLTKTSFMEPFYLGNLSIENIQTSQQNIALYLDVAIVSVLLRMKGRNLGFPFEGTYRFMRTWSFFSGQWMVIGESSNVIYEGSSGFAND